MENTAVGRMIGKTGEGVQEGWGDRRMGIGPETEKWLRDKAVFNNPHSISIPQTINEVAIGGGSVILDGAARAFGSAYHGGANFLGQLANEVGVGGGKQLASDIIAAPEAFAGVGSLQVNASRVATAAKSGQLAQDARAVSAATKEAVKDAAKEAGKYKVEVSGVGSTGGNIRIVKKEAAAAEKAVDDLPLTVAANPANGNPAAIVRGLGELNAKQQGVLARLPGNGSHTIAHKSFGQKDLAALTAATGDEFAMFTAGGRRWIVRGNQNSVPITPEKASNLAKKGWRWSSHVHPGTDASVLRSSGGDQAVLEAMGGSRSAVTNSAGERSIFTPQGDSLTGWKPW